MPNLSKAGRDNSDPSEPDESKTISDVENSMHLVSGCSVEEDIDDGKLVEVSDWTGSSFESTQAIEKKSQIINGTCASLIDSETILVDGEEHVVEVGRHRRGTAGLEAGM